MRFLFLSFMGFVSIHGMEANKFCECLSKLFLKTTSGALSYKEIQNQMKSLQGSLEKQSQNVFFSGERIENLEKENKKLESFVGGWIEKYNNSVVTLGERDETIKDLQEDLAKKEEELIKALTLIEDLNKRNEQLEETLKETQTKLNEMGKNYNVEENWTTLVDISEDDFEYLHDNTKDTKEKEPLLENCP